MRQSYNNSCNNRIFFRKSQTAQAVAYRSLSATPHEREKLYYHSLEGGGGDVAEFLVQKLVVTCGVHLYIIHLMFLKGTMPILIT